MDIDLGLLRTIEREKEIPFEELVEIIEQAIHSAYFRHAASRLVASRRAPSIVRIDSRAWTLSVMVW